MKRTEKKRSFKIRKAALKEAGAAFGLASRPYRIKLMPRQDELVQVEVPLDRDLCAKREVNLATIRLFRWDEVSERFHLIEDSRVDERWEKALARVFESGIYVAAGASSNPWVENAVSIMRTFGPLLHDESLGPLIRRRVCPVILCPNMLGRLFEKIGDPVQRGLPSLPPLDMCQFCLGNSGDPAHAVDLYPARRSTTGGGSCTACDLAAYLYCNPRIRQQIVWRDPAIRSYDSWTDGQKAELAEAFDTIRSGGVVGLPETAPATASLPDGLLDQLAPEDAWQAYVVHVAHTLVVDSCGWVDWSIRESHSLRLLLDSDAMFSITSTGHYRMLPQPHGYASHGDPTRVYQWLRSEGLIASNQLSTVGRVLEWCRDNMAHFYNFLTPHNAYLHWQYRGFPPVERIISGTDTPYGFNHWTAGCWGTAGFLRLVLRTINLPATMVVPCLHAQPYFPTIRRYLSHGDDPYSSYFRESGASGVDLLIDQATFDAWFDPANPERCDNVGRRPRELAGSE